jgi:hypothetical protein
MTSPGIVSPPPKPRPGQRALLPAEIRIFGADAEVCPETNFVFERGSGALSKAEQTALYKKRLTIPSLVAEYISSDLHAQIRHPELFKDKQT